MRTTACGKVDGALIRVQRHHITTMPEFVAVRRGHAATSSVVGNPRLVFALVSACHADAIACADFTFSVAFAAVLGRLWSCESRVDAIVLGCLVSSLALPNFWTAVLEIAVERTCRDPIALFGWPPLVW